jgi:hypothetical protein
MSQTNLPTRKIDKFTFAIVGTFITMAILVVITFRVVFTSFVDSYDIGTPDSGSELKVNPTLVEQTYSAVFNKAPR